MEDKKSTDNLTPELQELFRSNDSLRLMLEKAGSDLKHAEERAAFSEEMLGKVYSLSPDSININRLSDGMYIFINDGFTNITGYTWEDVAGKTSLELNIWADPAYRKILVEEVLKNGRMDNLETIFLKKDGNTVIGSMSALLLEINGVKHMLNITRDITSRKKAENDLNREQFLFNALMDNITDNIYFKDRESRFIRINKTLAHIFGLKDPAEAIGKTDFDFFTSEHSQQAFNDERKILETGQIMSMEEKETHHDRPDTWVSTVKMPLKDNHGKLIGTFGISRDITIQRYAEETLKQSEERFRSVAQTANDAIITADINGNIIGWNRGAEIAFGYQAWEIMGHTLTAIIPDDHQESHKKGIERFADDGNRIQYGNTVELHGLKKSGVIFPIELSLSDWKTSEGKFYTAIIRDITARKRTELETQTIYDITKGVTTTPNIDEFFKLTNQALSRIVYAENCFVALYDQEKGFFSFPYFVDKFDEAPSHVAMEKSCTAYVFRTEKPLILSQQLFEELRQKNEVDLVGSNSPSWIGIPLRIPSKVIGVLVLQDYEHENAYTEHDLKFLTSVGSQIAVAIDRKKTEEQIKDKNEQLQIINAEKDKFFSIIAHDLRGPLSSFVAATQLIIEEHKTMHLQEILELTKTMRTEANSVYSLLENLLEWSRLKRGVMVFNPVRLNLNNEIETVVNNISETAIRKGVNIESHISPGIFVVADSHMFDTIIRNLISNAIKFTPSGGKIELSAKKAEGSFFEIEVRDTGIGMSPELKRKLFLLNEKTGRPGTEGEPSSGLGLHLCKEFIEKHGGIINVESEIGKGTRFVFTIPGE
jgi:PAS domain S-box-containing protein